MKLIPPLLSMTTVVALTIAVSGFPPQPVEATATAAADGWSSTWSVAYEGAGGAFPAQTTARQIVHTSIGGTAARVRLSNTFNSQPLTLTDFHLAQRASGPAIVAATDRPVTFAGHTSVTIPPGGQAVSDPVAFVVAPESDVAVSFFVPVLTQNVASHQFAFENQYLADGNVTAASNLAVRQTYSSYFIVSDLDVLNPAATGSVVALGASITEGHSTTPRPSYSESAHRYRPPPW